MRSTAGDQRQSCCHQDQRRRCAPGCAFAGGSWPIRLENPLPCVELALYQFSPRAASDLFGAGWNFWRHRRRMVDHHAFAHSSTARRHAQRRPWWTGGLPRAVKRIGLMVGDVSSSPWKAAGWLFRIGSGRLAACLRRQRTGWRRSPPRNPAAVVFVICPDRSSETPGCSGVGGCRTRGSWSAIQPVGLLF